MKYHNRKTIIDGVTFDSQKEANRYCELKLLERAHAIRDLKRQIGFELIPPQKGERSVSYIADFVYEENGKDIVEDVKGMKTRDYIIKRKLFKIHFPEYEFREV